MRAVRIHEDGGPEVLRVDDVPVPEPGEGEALVRLRAASLNHLDVWVRKGLPSVPKPRTLGADGAGTVEEIGPGATGFSPGDAVTINPGVFCGHCAACLAGDQSLCPTFGVIGEHCNGTHAEFVVVPTRNLHPIPDGLGFEQAAAFPLVFVTAYRMLFTRARLRPGEWVMIWGIGGGVGSAALELAQAAGARVIALSSQAAKLAKAKERGAHAVVDASADDVADRVREITGGRGADVVVEHVGDATWNTSLDAVARGGRVVTCGASTGGRAPAGLHRIFWKQISVLGSTMGTDSEFRSVLALLAAGRVRPVIDSVFPLEDAARAHERLEASEQFGKIVLRIGSE